MENTKQITLVIERKFQELQEYTEAYNKLSQKNKEEVMDKARLQFQKNPEKVDLESIGRDIFLTSGFHQADIRKMQEGLLSAYKIFEELGIEYTFSQDLLDAISFLKSSLPKQFFAYSTSKEEFEEIEKGKLEQAKEDYTKKNYFKLFEDQIKKAIANE